MATFGVVTEAASDARQRVADRVFAVAAMSGGVVGAVAGAMTGMALNLGHPTIGGVAGTMLGSAICVAIGLTIVLPRLLARGVK